MKNFEPMAETNELHVTTRTVAQGGLRVLGKLRGKGADCGVTPVISIGKWGKVDTDEVLQAIAYGLWAFDHPEQTTSYCTWLKNQRA